METSPRPLSSLAGYDDSRSIWFARGDVYSGNFIWGVQPMGIRNRLSSQLQGRRYPRRWDRRISEDS